MILWHPFYSGGTATEWPILYLRTGTLDWGINYVR